MKTNDIKKGMRIRLRNGWYGTMEESRNGNVRMARVEGFYTESGSIYAHDIVAVRVDGVWQDVELTQKQEDFRTAVEAQLS
jgi:hypothetical protein